MKKLMLAAVLALAAIAAGCGGGGGGSALSADDYRSRLNAICEDFNQKQTEIGEPQNLEEVGQKGDEILDEFDKAIAEVEDLNPPDELQKPHDEFLDLGKQQRDILQKVVDAAKDGDEAEASREAEEAGTLDDRSDAVATDELQAPACAED